MKKAPTERNTSTHENARVPSDAAAARNLISTMEARPKNAAAGIRHAAAEGRKPVIAMQAAAPSRITCGEKSKPAFRQDSCTLASPANTTEPKKSVTWRGQQRRLRRQNQAQQPAVGQTPKEKDHTQHTESTEGKAHAGQCPCIRRSEATQRQSRP